MIKKLDTALSVNYTSNSQKIRVMSETWTENNIFCPNCGSVLESYKNNRPVADFYCKKCYEDFELKSKNGKIGKKVGAGSYQKMIERLNSSENPNFFFLSYLKQDYSINDFFVVPKHFFVEGIIEKRKALSENAKRAGWVGSNILFYKIPNSGKIYYIENGCSFSKNDVLKKWKHTDFLKKINKNSLKGWILDVMNCIESLDKEDFELDEIYAFVENLEILHPENKNIKAKIRQQLQFLRDKKYLTFLGNGKYSLN